MRCARYSSVCVVVCAGVIGVSCIALAGCAVGVGAATGSIVHDRQIPSAGLKATSLANLAMFGGPALAVGLDSEVLSRTDHTDHWGQWRMSALLGATKLPRPSDCFLGYEFFIAPGAARVYDTGRPALRLALGGQLGAPMRLFGGQPAWRSDDVVGTNVYLVPSLAATWFGGATAAVSVGLTLRMSLWSAILP